MNKSLDIIPLYPSSYDKAVSTFVCGFPRFHWDNVPKPRGCTLYWLAIALSIESTLTGAPAADLLYKSG